MEKNRIRLSYTLCDLWSKGRIDDAVNVYLHLPSTTTPQIEQGRALHAKWANDIRTNNKLKIGRTEISFKNPICEYGENGELNKQYNDLFDVGGRWDALDGDTFYEFKSGKTNSLSYSGGYQIPFYFLLASLSNIHIKKAFIFHYNQYSNESDYMMIWNDQDYIVKAKNFIDSVAPEIQEYFEKYDIHKPL